jgi:hypothetical protein
MTGKRKIVENMSFKERELAFCNSVNLRLLTCRNSFRAQGHKNCRPYTKIVSNMQMGAYIVPGCDNLYALIRPSCFKFPLLTQSMNIIESELCNQYICIFAKMRVCLGPSFMWKADMIAT